MISTWHAQVKWQSSKQPWLTTITTWRTTLSPSRFRNGFVSSLPIVWPALAKNGWIDSFVSTMALTTTNGWSPTTNNSHPVNPLSQGKLRVHYQLASSRCSHPRFLTVAEQMVTDFEHVDMTPTLISNTYWASYNNVYFPRFRDISGEEKMAQLKGPQLYSWQNSSRARIFARDHVKVVDMPTMINMMRFVFVELTFLVHKFCLLHGLDTTTSHMILYPRAVARLRIPQN